MCEQDQRQARSVFLHTEQRSAAPAQVSIDLFSLIVVAPEVLSVETDLPELFLFPGDSILSVREGWSPRILLPEQARANTVHASQAFISLAVTASNI